MVPSWLPYGLGISAGVALYVGASDLVPEVNREPGIRMALVFFAGRGRIPVAADVIACAVRSVPPWPESARVETGQQLGVIPTHLEVGFACTTAAAAEGQRNFHHRVDVAAHQNFQQ